MVNVLQVNLEQAAATLGINVTTLRRKRRYYGIS